MPLELKPATEADAKRAAIIERDAYAPNPFSRILFPGPFPPEALDGRAGFLATELKEDSTTRWLKVVDTDLPEDEQMIAFAKWHIYTEKPKPTAPRTFGPGCNVEACEMLFPGIAAQRMRILGDKPYVYLSLLHTDPKHQGRGAGGMLVTWGVDEARKLGLIAYLESTEAGHSVYAKCGFRDVECMSLDMSKWGATEMHNTWSMIYDPSETPA
ncbi:acyl-CoA N-acyltransferase [Hypomontagnella submonticulosa]|nr:acyl-CoA N-acyltransferase [Hypomontagnella submonticulosa]